MNYTELIQELDSLMQSFNRVKIHLCKFRRRLLAVGDTCTYFHEPTNNDDCSDCVNTYDVWELKEKE